MTFRVSELEATLHSWPAARRYCVAFSGGLDSSVLLHAMAALRSELPAPLRAIHINHRLNAEADRWQERCHDVCEKLGIEYLMRYAALSTDRSQSLEARARDARYLILRKLVTPDEMMLTAHHRDDQVETVLLQLLRGAGPAGLAAMPPLTTLGCGRLGRPLLGVSRAALRAFADAEGLDWNDDSSNADIRFDRNYLRARVIPLLKSRWPAVARTASRSARHCAQAAGLLADLAAVDLARSRAEGPDRLSIASFKDMRRARQANLIRHWLVDLGLPRPPTSKLTQILSEVTTAAPDARPLVVWPGAEVRRYRNCLWAMRPLPELPNAGAVRTVTPEMTLTLDCGLGQLRLEATRGEGLSRLACAGRRLNLRFRIGGERCRLADEAHHKPLKKLLQERGIVPWMRFRLPLVFAGDSLAAIPEVGVCESFAARVDEPAWRIIWSEHPLLR